MSSRPKAMPPRDETPVERHLRQRRETLDAVKAIVLLLLFAAGFGALLAVPHPLTQLIAMALS